MVCFYWTTKRFANHLQHYVSLSRHTCNLKEEGMKQTFLDKLISLNDEFQKSLVEDERRELEVA